MEHALTGLSWRGLLAVAYIAYVSTIAGFGLWNRLIARYSVARVAPFSLLVPVFGLLASALLLDERLGLGQWGAAGVVLAGLALVIRRPRAARAVAVAPDHAAPGDPHPARPAAAAVAAGGGTTDPGAPAPAAGEPAPVYPLPGTRPIGPNRAAEPVG